MEVDDSPAFEFIPSRYGCYSPNLSRTLQKLQDKHLIKSYNYNDDVILTLTVEGRWYAMGLSSSRMNDFLKSYSLRGNDLILDIYNRFPYWGIKSISCDSILLNDYQIINKIKNYLPKGNIKLASIGYQNRSFENYLNALIKNNINILCDVRKNPVSRIYGFSKSTLMSACKYLDIEYIHYPELGIPSNDRVSLKTQEDYDSLFKYYEKKILPKSINYVDEIISFINSNNNVALTCFEENPEQCHRTRILNYISRNTGIKPKLI